MAEICAATALSKYGCKVAMLATPAISEVARSIVTKLCHVLYMATQIFKIGSETWWAYPKELGLKSNISATLRLISVSDTKTKLSLVCDSFIFVFWHNAVLRA